MIARGYLSLIGSLLVTKQWVAHIVGVRSHLCVNIKKKELLSSPSSNICGFEYRFSSGVLLVYIVICLKKETASCSFSIIMCHLWGVLSPLTRCLN